VCGREKEAEKRSTSSGAKEAKGRKIDKREVFFILFIISLWNMKNNPNEREWAAAGLFHVQCSSTAAL
jgi:hypothetical protein